jgi:hypothetical protein
MRRAAYTVIGALIGAIAALLDHFYLAGPMGSAPQVTAEWLAFYAGICIPWAAIGAVIGLVSSGRPKART